MGNTTFKELKIHCQEHRKKHKTCCGCEHCGLCDDISELIGRDMCDLKKEGRDEKEKA
jgi:hypothetical protein